MIPGVRTFILSEEDGSLRLANQCGGETTSFRMCLFFVIRVTKFRARQSNRHQEHLLVLQADGCQNVPVDMKHLQEKVIKKSMVIFII